MTDDLTENDWRGVQRLMLVVEDRLGKADAVTLAFEDIVARAGAFIGTKDREEFERHFRTLVRPLVELELKRRADKERTSRCSGRRSKIVR